MRIVGEARHAASEVGSAGQIGRRSHGARQESAAKRRVRDEADAEFGRGGNHVLLDVAAPDRPLALNRGDRMHRHGGAQLVGRHLRQPEVTNLAGGHQFGHRPDGLLDRHRQVAAMHVVEVDDVGLEAVQTFVDALAYVGGVAARGEAAARRPVRRVPDDAELRRQRDLVAAVGQQAGDETFVRAAAVDVGGVDERDPQVDAAMKRGQRLGVVHLAVDRESEPSPRSRLH